MKITLNRCHDELPQRWLSGMFLLLWCCGTGAVLLAPIAFLFVLKRVLPYALFQALLALYAIVLAPLMAHRAAVVCKKCIAAFHAGLSNETA